MDRITLRRPDDFHLHLRDGAAMAAVVRDSARRFARAIVMPNLKPPVRTTQQALDYRERILGELRAHPLFRLDVGDAFLRQVRGDPHLAAVLVDALLDDVLDLAPNQRLVLLFLRTHRSYLSELSPPASSGSRAASAASSGR